MIEVFLDHAETNSSSEDYEQSFEVMVRIKLIIVT